MLGTVCAGQVAVAAVDLQKTQKVQSGVSSEWSLLPEEADIPYFPQPISDEEDNLDVIETYYQAVAHAYQGWAELKQRQADMNQVQVQKLKTRLFVKGLKDKHAWNAQYKYRPQADEQAHLNTIRYYTQQIHLDRLSAEEALDKSLYYASLAEHCTQLKSAIQQEGQPQKQPSDKGYKPDKEYKPEV
jgi:hypothetical protein